MCFLIHEPVHIVCSAGLLIIKNTHFVNSTTLNRNLFNTSCGSTLSRETLVNSVFCRSSYACGLFCCCVKVFLPLLHCYVLASSRGWFLSAKWGILTDRRVDVDENFLKIDYKQGDYISLSQWWTSIHARSSHAQQLLLMIEPSVDVQCMSV